ncbi:MAG: hypothetical protein Kow00129_12870 [Thermoleophilia bacterium]
MHTARHQGWEAYVRIEADLDERLTRSRGRGVKGRAAARHRSPSSARLRLRRLAALFVVLGIAASLVVLLTSAGCGYGDEVSDAGPVTTLEPANGEEDEDGAPPDTESTTTTLAESPDELPEELKLTVYFPRGDKIGAAARVVPYTRQTAEAAIEELLQGPTQTEIEQADMSTSIPEGTTLLGLDVDADGTATIDLSKEFASGGGTLSMTMRLAQVVFTLTQFPTVDAVSFRLDGEPVTVFGGEGILLEEPVGRAYFEDVTPAILVENPAVGEVISSPVHLTGSANVFEATFQVNIVNWDGLILKEETVTATSGTGTRGTFDVTVPFDPQQPEAEAPGTIIVFTYSAKDGTQQDVVEIPVRIRK